MTILYKRSKIFTSLLFALFACLYVQGQNYLLNGQPINDCDGFFLDSGGGSGDYGRNEDFTSTICADGVGLNTHIKLNFSGVLIEESDTLYFYDGIDEDAPLLSHSRDFDENTPFIIQATAANPSGCITVVFHSDGSGQAAGWSAAIECTPSCQVIQAELFRTDPEIMPADTGYIDVCPNQEIFLSGRGVYPQNDLFYHQSDSTSTFNWDFGDGTMAVGPTVRHTYQKSGGYIIQLTITDGTNQCTNANYISQRVRVSPRPNFLVMASEGDLCVNDTITFNSEVNVLDPDMNVSAAPNEATFQVAGIRSDSLALPDGTGSSYETSIDFNDFSPGQMLMSVDDLQSICVNIEHSWMRDLTIDIKCPSGETVQMHNHPGNFGSGVRLGIPTQNDGSTPLPGQGLDYCWIPETNNPTWIEWANRNDGIGFETLPPGDYSSFEPLEALVGCPLNGEWSIKVTDLWAQDNGFIFSWSINFNPDLYPSLETFTPTIVNHYWQDDPSIFFQTPDSIAASPTNPGQAAYTFVVEDNFNCTWDTMINYSVLPPTHPDCRDCEENITPVEDATVCENESLFLDASVEAPTAEEVKFEAYPNEPFGAATHPPALPLVSTIEVNSLSPEIILNPTEDIVSICIDIETDYNEDLAIQLRTPTGIIFPLSINNGGDQENYTQTCFTPNATERIETGTAPFTGDFQPEGDWALLTGSPINGEWELLVSDAFDLLAVGNLNQWSITFNTINAITYSWTPAVGLSCDDCPDPEFTGTTSTLYTLQATDSYGCNTTDDVQITVFNDISAPTVNCDITDEFELTFDWDEVDGQQNYQVRLNNGQWQSPNNGNFSHVLTGVGFNEEMLLEVQANIQGLGPNCVVETGSSTCRYNLCGIATNFSNGPNAVSCNGGSDGSVSLSTTGGVAPYTYALDGGASQSSPSFSNISAGEHQIIVADVNACLDTVLFNIAEPAPIEIELTMLEEVSCNGGNNGMATANVTGGTGTYSYLWSSNERTATANMLSAGMLFVTVTDARGCEEVAELRIEEPEVLELSIDATPTLCSNTFDGTASAVVTGGVEPYNYRWDNNRNTANIKSLFRGTYCLTVTDARGCEISNCTEITSPTELTLQTGQNPAKCFGESSGQAFVTAEGGTGTYTYIWSDEFAQNRDTATMLAIGNYTVTVQDVNACESAASVTVTQPTPLEVMTEVADVLCFGGESGRVTALPSGGTMPYNYQWSDAQAQTTATAENLSIGDYAVVVTDANNCQNITSVNVRQPDNAVSLMVEQTEMGCFGMAQNTATATAAGGTGTNYTFEWSNGQDRAQATALDTVTYVVEVKDKNGCLATASIRPRDLEPIMVNAAFSQPSCFGASDASIAVNIIEGGTNEGYTYLWNTNPASTGEFVENISGGRNYTVTATDSKGCQGTNTINLPQPAEISFSIFEQDVRCFNGNNGEATINNITGDNSEFTIRWDGRAGNQTTMTASNLTAGTYEVTVMDTAGCFTTKEAVISQPSMLQSNIKTVDNICNGNAEGQVEVEVEGGIPGYNYIWSNGASSDKVGALLAGNYDLTVVDNNGCELYDRATIEQPEPLTANFQVVGNSCFGDRDGRIKIFPDGGSPPYRYSIDNEIYNGASTLVGLKEGSYDIYIRDRNNCLLLDERYVSQPEEFTVNIESATDKIEVGDSLLLNATALNNQGEVEFVWSEPYAGVLNCSECKQTSAKPMNTVYVELYGVDEKGCEATDRLQVMVTKTRVVAVPTGFTPNGDNINDILMVHGKIGTKVTTFRVFDRWGELVYEALDFTVNDKNIGWDGTFRNKNLQGGTYVWYLEAEYIDGEKEVFKGNTNLIR